ncbi:MAG: ATP-binding protein, partial [Spirochaetes bacterium]|nr:ATP-binding protein [Spirochaetota bacterium]
SDERSALICVAVPEKDLLLENESQRKSLFFIAISVFIIGLLLVLTFTWIYNYLLGKKIKPERTEKSLLSTIKKGENSHLEFKSSLRWDFHNSTANRKLEEVILKSIAAFNNSEGGIVMIGINDKGEVLGLEHDYRTLKDGNKDNFELHLRNLVNSAYGVEYSANNMTISFPRVKGIEICLIEIKKGETPLYTMITDKHGEKQEKFYMRSGNSSQELPKLSEITTYINKRFDLKKH